MVYSVLTCNVNGIRAAQRRGFWQFLSLGDFDVICLQETKASLAILSDECFKLPGYHAAFSSAEKSGYSGVAVYSKLQPERVEISLGTPHFDTEGRICIAEFPHTTIMSLYLPSGTSGESRQLVKESLMAYFFKHVLQPCATNARDVIIAGDWNIAHAPIDIKNWKSNQRNSGFLPHERSWLDQVFDSLGWIDTYRTLHPEGHEYTWWTYRAGARQNNVGWRIDYQVAHPRMRDKLQRCGIVRDPVFSDHAPYWVEYSGVL